MIILTIFAFLAGTVTILSPCILPILPVILASSPADPSSRRRPYGIITGFVLSFTFFTLFLSTLVRIFGIPADSLRTLSVIVIALFGLSLLIPRLGLALEQLFSHLTSYTPSTSGKTGFFGGLLIGLSLGLLWTPCVGPILASVITLAISGTITLDAVILTLAYSLGTAIPMYLIIQAGQALFTKVPWLLQNTAKIQRSFGIVMIVTALMISAGLDRTFQSYLITQFPQYGAGLTRFEDQPSVTTQLKDLGKSNLPLATKGSLAPELVPGGQWFNTPALTLAELRGKVVLIDFWTYSCINCQRTLPYLKTWYDKYNDDGLIIIGVHAPEFEFEKNPANVSDAIAEFGLKYPVMQDNDFATWKAYNNHYWPAKYFIDKDGFIRHTHFGEGGYDESEKVIQDLLQETGVEVTNALNNPSYQTYGRTPETYLGSARSGRESYLSYSGDWTTTKEYAAPAKGSQLTLNFDAKSVYLVMRPGMSQPARVKVFLDSIYYQTITVDADKLYTLVELPDPGRHTLRLEFEDGNVELFAFTFG